MTHKTFLSLARHISGCGTILHIGYAIARSNHSVLVVFFALHHKKRHTKLHLQLPKHEVLAHRIQIIKSIPVSYTHLDVYKRQL